MRVAILALLLASCAAAPVVCRCECAAPAAIQIPLWNGAPMIQQSDGGWPSLPPGGYILNTYVNSGR